MPSPLEKLLAPPQQVMDRARVAKLNALVSKIDDDLDRVRDDIRTARAAVATKDCTVAQYALAAALAELDDLLDVRLKVSKAASA